ncbi:hypothetical protein [Ponticoccus sp. (in: a-proteobacteria)]|uniref:hypothetical protein n=1 Tax=Ponticoccus sp. (in: a-proteobacteria) TaxID=1925025 RepID=UPI003AB349FF
MVGDLLQAYVAAGLDPSGFWELSLRAYARHMQGARDRLQAEQQGRAWAAWHAAALLRQDKLMGFAEFMDGRDTGPQSPEDLQAAFNMMATAWGAEPYSGG